MLMACFLLPLVQKMRIPAKLQDALGIAVLMSDLVSLNSVREMAVFVAEQMASQAPGASLIVHRDWPDNLRPASTGQQALYAACLADASGIGVGALPTQRADL